MLKSPWKKVRLTTFDRLNESLEVDVLVVGGGMTGLTTAYLLKNEGRTVAVIERDRCGQLDTGNTTAHLTYVTDLRIHQLVKTFGRDHGQAVWDAGQCAIDQIAQNIEKENISCEFHHVPGFLFASLSDDENGKEFRKDAKVGKELGFAAEFVRETPIFGRCGVRFANQAAFHPLLYLNGIVTRIPGSGSHIFERTEAKQFERSKDGEHIRVKAKGKTIACRWLVIATDVPVTGLSNLASATLLQSKISPYTSYAIGARIPKDLYPRALYWDTSDPYYYLRIDRHGDHDYAIFGGLDHKTGQKAASRDPFAKLERILLKFVPEAKRNNAWSGQVIESYDGLPFIGETAERQYVATGFSGNGMTFGTLAAIMIRDAIVGRKNPWSDLFSPSRKKIRRGAWKYFRENLDYPYYMLKDRLSPGEGVSLKFLSPGEGKIMNLDGERLAVYRDENGEVTKLSPVCTHLGCIVHWNKFDRTWDCPCHGSRFRPTGELLAGPAETGLDRAKSP